MSKGRKSSYPLRPQRRGKPVSSTGGGRKSKTWVSLRDKVDNGRDVSDRLNTAWWKSPMYSEARTRKWA